MALLGISQQTVSREGDTQMIRLGLKNSKSVIWAGIILLLALAVACGSSATATTAPTATSGAVAPTAVVTEPTPASPPNEAPTSTPAAVADATATAVPVATAEPTAEPKGFISSTTQLVYSIGAVANETNRTWAGSRQAYVQFEPMLENLLSKDVLTGQIVPRLATSWSAANDMKDWTFTLREGVEFHDGWGEFTAADVMHTLKILCREDTRLSTCTSVTGGTARADDINYEEVLEIVDPYTIIFHSPRTNSIQTFNMGKQSAEMSPWSVAFWEAEGVDGLDAKGLVGTNTYQYLERDLGQSLTMEKIDYDHWSGENPEFQEFKIVWIPEAASRYAGMLAGEVHVADLPIDLQQDSLTKGMKLIKSRFQANDVSIFFGGSYYSSDPLDTEAFDPDQPWNDIRVRQAMNLAINREELGDFLYAGFWENMYIDGFHPTLEGWDDTWPARYEAEYKYDPDRAIALLAEAGFGPDNPVKVSANSYISPGESELPQIMEAITIYWNKVGIDTSLVDLDGTEVANRYRGRKMQNQVWPNIIIYFPIEYYMNIAYTSGGVTKHYVDDFLNARVKDLQGQPEPGARQVIAQDIGNHMFDNHVSMPLFWFSHTIAVNPDVVSDWIYPGNTVPRLCCAAFAKATR
jgi:ABC-type transport system substrate-binding protein